MKSAVHNESITMHQKRKKAEVRTPIRALQSLKVNFDKKISLKRLVDLMKFIVDSTINRLVTSLKFGWL